METRVYTEENDIPVAAASLRLGGLVAVPTETVYGLCANGLDAEAVAHLYEVKGRPEVKPLSLMVAGPAEIEKYAEHIPPAAFILAARFWPGPLTLVLEAKKDVVPSIVRAGKDTVGLRCRRTRSRSHCLSAPGCLLPGLRRTLRVLPALRPRSRCSPTLTGRSKA